MFNFTYNLRRLILLLLKRCHQATQNFFNLSIVSPPPLRIALVKLGLHLLHRKLGVCFHVDLLIPIINRICLSF